MDDSGEVTFRRRTRSCSPKITVSDQQNFSQKANNSSHTDSENNDGKILRAVEKLCGELQSMENNIRNLTEDSHSMKDHIYHLENRTDCPQPPVLRYEGRSGMGNHGGANLNENHGSPPYRHVNQRSQRHMAERSNIKLKPHYYDGKEDFEEYLSQFEIIGEINNWEYADKGLYLAGVLCGSARAVFTELSSIERQDFDTLVNILNVRYGSIERSEMFRAKLQTRVRGRDETLSELAQSIRTLTRKAYPTADSSLTNILALDHFIDSISDSEIRLRIRELRPKNINEAETHAIRLEAHRLADKQMGKTAHQYNRSVNYTQTSEQEIHKNAEEIDLATLNRSILSLGRSTKQTNQNILSAIEKTLTKLSQNQGQTYQQQYPSRRRNDWNNNGQYQNQQFQSNRQSRGDNRWSRFNQGPQNQSWGQNSYTEPQQFDPGQSRSQNHYNPWRQTHMSNTQSSEPVQAQMTENGQNQSISTDDPSQFSGQDQGNY